MRCAALRPRRFPADLLMAPLLLMLAGSVAAQDRGAEPDPSSWEEATAGAEMMAGFLPLHWKPEQGELLLELPTELLERELLYVESLAAGIGSNDIGLDRGQIGDSHLVTFRRVGPKVLLVAKNTRYRAETDNALERRAVEEAFAESVLWGFEVAAAEEERLLIDATDFALRDAHRVAATLKQRGQGGYKLDASRSAVFLPRTKVFPDNTEIEATLTFVGEPEGAWIRSVTPSPEQVTVRQHHSFVRLPEPWTPRAYDPRSGFISRVWSDYGTPITEKLERRVILRHRLEKRRPKAERSEVVEPIVYYLDPGTPEPIRSALLDGARWWAGAFEAAGFIDGFRVEMLPEDADPMDLRYNVIQWVHRSTRGWSYGNAVVDPRTGEILKGKVTLGSLRVRQDFLIAEALLSPYDEPGEVPVEMSQMALARLRQLSAHEVGHTIGITHNFAASTNDRASVMDYPYPLARLDGRGQIDLSDAYAVGIGAWDVRAVLYGYSQFAPGTDEGAALERILRETDEQGLLFISDQDARPLGGAHPRAHLWDNGEDAAEELERLLDVRRVALDRFGERAIRWGTPFSELEDPLVPLYLFHRYQLEAAAKLVGGVDYRYATRGDGQPAATVVPVARQRAALEALLRSVDPDELTLREELLRLLPPPAEGYRRDRESFPTRTGTTFDPVSAARVAADLTFEALLHPARATRLVEQGARVDGHAGFVGVVDAVIEATWQALAPDGLAGAVKRAVDRSALDHLLAVARSSEASSQARGVALMRVQDLEGWLQRYRDPSVEDAAHHAEALRVIDRFLRHPTVEPEDDGLRVPDGSPIGSASGSTGGGSRSGVAAFYGGLSEACASAG